MQEIKKLNIAPTVGLLGLLKNMRYNEWYALSEFVDNSVQSYYKNKRELKKHNPNYKLKVKIYLNSSEIVIRDNAAGIHTSRYQAAFETGKPPPDKTGLSEFGVGMKIAACWFADKWTVHTSAIGENFWRLVEFDIKKIQQNLINELDVTTGKTTASQGYTIVTLTKLNHKPRGQTVHNIKEHLSSIYRNMIETNEIEILIDDEKLKYERPEIKKTCYWKDLDEGIISRPKKYKWFKKFEFDYKHQPVNGWVGIRARGSTKQNGFCIIRRNRIIINSFKPPEIFGQGNDRRQQVIFGEINLDHVPVTFSKNDFVWSDDEKNKFVKLLKDAIEFYDEDKKISIISQAKEWTENMEKKDVRKRSKKTLDEIGRFIQKGIEQASDKLEIKKPVEKTIPGKNDEIDKKTYTFIVRGNKWNLTVNYEYDLSADELYSITKKDKDSNNFRNLQIFINLKHPLVGRFFSEDVSGLAILISYFSIAEVEMTNVSGIREAHLMRIRFNEFCQNIPPRR